MEEKKNLCENSRVAEIWRGKTLLLKTSRAGEYPMLKKSRTGKNLCEKKVSGRGIPYIEKSLGRRKTLC